MCSEPKWNEVTLYTASCDDVTLDDALEKLNGLTSDKLTLLVYTPSFCGFAHLNDRKIVALKTEPDVKNKDIFELRAFCENCELRWVRENDDGKGRGVLISEKEFRFGEEKVEAHDKCFPLQSEYILWGRKKADVLSNADAEQKTIKLFEHRIGELLVPLPKSGSGDRVCLRCTEYFSADEYGNLNWRTERLVGLEWMPYSN